MFKQSTLKFSISFKVFIVLFTTILSCNAPNHQAVPEKPNIILILTDDQGWGDLSMNGNSELSTPNIDQLAQEGAVFDRFYVSPVCSPTRAEILTGRYHVRGGVYSTSAGGERLDLDENTIAEIFQDNGYKTAAYGKWHNGMQYPYHPNARGFDDFYGFCSGHWGNYFSPLLEHNGKIVKGNGYLSDDLTKHAIDFIHNNKDNPFFLYLPFNTPHSPMQVPDEWWNKFASKELKNDHRFRGKEDLQHTKAAYAMCENIDWNVGKIMQEVEDLSLAKNTIIIFLSDNGPNGWRWNEGMAGIKGSTNEGGVRSPFIIRWKGMIDANKRISQIASAIDVLPTLTDLAGIITDQPNSIDGKSLKELLLNKNVNWEERFIVNNWKNQVSIRSQQFRLDNENRLYQMQEDPGQKIDIAQNHPEVFNEMLTYKKRWIKEVYSDLPQKDERTIPVGHPEFGYTQLPARDGVAHGNIKRSNRWPNCSFFTNWLSIQDSITWDVEVLEDGDFEAIVYYTCKEENIGSTIKLGFLEKSISKKITAAHSPPLTGAENDRVERQESYVKDFVPLNMGTIKLKKGTGTLSLNAVDIKGTQLMDFRLLMLNGVDIN